MTMSEISSEIRSIVQKNGGSIRGKIRLQKTFYFLEVSGLGLGFDFDYYHYGPYSEELSVATDDAIALGQIACHWEQAGPYAYAVFESEPAQDRDLSELDKRQIDILKVLDKYSSIVLELAATADFLELSGYGEEAWNETRARKSAKATDDRIALAKTLLNEIGRGNAN